MLRSGTLVVWTVLLVPSLALATSFTGALSWDADEDELVAANNWAGTGTLITYDVEEMASSDTWYYRYTLTVDSAQGSGISNFVLELSDNVTSGDILSARPDDPAEVGTIASNPGNPMPEAMYGAKWEDFDEDEVSETLVVEFELARMPVWGDFSAKGGPNSTVWNAGFTKLDTDPGNPVDNPGVTGHIVVPDSVYVPEPATMAFLMLGVPALFRRRRG
ncbi:MAG: PEP-CTERM sorting domain-containing protein [Phycisphaerae bacterium]|nr:PEP-CTERM sorting domain-containing protein [Phycisphaerae bacterium]